ncbi:MULTISPECIES: hypothetical protein [unclassified Synechococcus]|uniref:hypothetical protein n=1 Tax=unclassified Synechococcus TaxID=2626047 RepID=UPI0013C37784|nr:MULTISPECIES: hypothetical protein [unclassified Synechococcus]
MISSSPTNGGKDRRSTKRITIEVSMSLYQRARLLCMAEDMSLNYFCRQAIAEACENKGADAIQLIDERQK